MALIKDTQAVDNKALEAAQAEAAAAVESETPLVVEASDDVLEVAPEPTPALESAETAVAVVEAAAPTVSAQRTASQAAMLGDMANRGFEGLKIDFSSFPSIVLKDGEFQVSGSTKAFDGKKGFDGIITGTRKKVAMRVGGDDDGDVVFADEAKQFQDPNTEAGAKVQEWKAKGLKPELKEYIEAFTMITVIHDPDADVEDLIGSLVVVQVSPTSCGRFSGYTAIQQMKHGLDPNGYQTNFSRGEKVTNTKFPFYPWNFKLVSLN